MKLSLGEVFWVPLLWFRKEGLNADHHGIKCALSFSHLAEAVYETSVSDDQKETATYC